MADIEVADAAAGEITQNGSAVAALRQANRGNVYTPSDGDYEQARKVWNGMIDRHPAAIVRCRDVADVMEAVRYAKKQRLPVSVRGGGHNVSGSAVCDEGVVIDLSEMRGVRVDPVRKTARVDGGARLGDIDHATQAFGLAVPAGVVSRTGIAGLTLHGGMGFLTRKFGLTCDNLISADVVTASGNLVIADEEQNPDLLWALRGGGGNFGVVTSFEFRLQEVGPEVFVVFALYPAEKAHRVLSYHRDFMQSAAEEISAIAVLWNAPEGDPIPEAYHGAPVAIIAACYAGAPEVGERALQPFREIETPIADLSGRVPFIAAQQIFDPDYPDGRRYYWKSIYLPELTDDVLEAILDHAATRPSPISSVDVWAIGGAVARVPNDATAFAWRDAPFLLGIEANWDDPSEDDANVGWARNVYDDMLRFSPGGAYLNFPGFAEDGGDLAAKSYAGNYGRLQAIKAKYDPENLFRMNVNIQPAAAG